MAHAALRLDGSILSGFYTNVGDCPERILLSTIDLTPAWRSWVASAAMVMFEPERDCEGRQLPQVPSVRGLVSEPVGQLRDPAIFREHGHAYLLYAVAGEREIAMAELTA
jgi:hypothetical protein